MRGTLSRGVGRAALLFLLFTAAIAVAYHFLTESAPGAVVVGTPLPTASRTASAPMASASDVGQTGRPLGMQIQARRERETLAQRRTAYRMLCTQHSDSIARLEETQQNNPEFLRLKSIHDRQCRPVDAQRGRRAIMRSDTITPDAMIDPTVLAGNLPAVLDELDFIKQKLVFRGIKYTGGDYLAALFAFRLVPCEFGFECGSENFDVRLACAQHNICMANLKELVLSNARDSGLSQERIHQLLMVFSDELRSSHDPLSLESPFGLNRN